MTDEELIKKCLEGVKKRRFKPDWEGFKNCIECERDTLIRAIPIIRKEKEEEHARLVEVARSAGKADGFIEGYEKARKEVAEGYVLAKKALSVIEGSLLIDEPEDRRLSFIYRMAHVGNGECEHSNWKEELERVYHNLCDENIVSEPSGDKEG